MALLSLEAIRDGVRTDPSFYIQNLDLARQAVLVLLLDEGAFRAASFLDDRILTPMSQGRWLGFAELASMMAPAPARAPVHFIFHAGHVGSTLISRLLDDVDGVLGLREPLPLRTLATSFGELSSPTSLVDALAWQALLRTQLACWGRGYANTSAVVVKATSSAAQCCSPILDALPQARTLHLSLRAEPYLATLLAGENSYIDLRGHAQDRRRRLLQVAASPGAPLHALSLGEIAAMTWSIETLTHHSARSSYAEQVLSVDFDAFLAAPSELMRRICNHFRLEASEGYFDGVVRSPVLTRYSKAPEHAYTPELRRQILTASRARNAQEIRKGLAWIEALARRNPELAAPLLA